MRLIGQRFLFWFAGLASAVIATVLQAAGAGENSGQDMIWLDNGERLRGELVSFVSDQQVVWRHPEISESLIFPLREVNKIRLGPRTRSASAPANPCLVRFTDQEEIQGNLALQEGSPVIIETWYAGTLQVERSQIESFQPLVGSPKIVYAGADGLAGWTVGSSAVPGVDSNAWSFSQGAFIATTYGSIGRDVKLTPLASIEFDAAWSEFLQLAIALYTDTLQPINLNQKDEAPDFSGFYSVQIHANTVQVLCVKKGVPLGRLDAAIVNGLESRSAAHIGIRVNKNDGTIFLFVNGSLVKSWKDPAQTVGAGTGLRFVNQSSGGLRLSNLVISEWDGRLDLAASPVVNVAQDYVRLINRDTVEGRLTTVTNGQLSVQTQNGLLSIPLQRVEQVHLSRNGRQSGAPPGEGKVKASFADKGVLWLKIEGWENQRILASSPVLGRVALDPAALLWLEFKNAPPPAPSL